MAFDLLTKVSRLVGGQRYSSTDLGSSQEAFASSLQLGTGEIWSQDYLIPSASLPFFTASAVNSTTSSGVLKYWYRYPMTTANNTLTGSSVWYFTSPSGSTSGIGSQLIDPGQQTNFISPKYGIPSISSNNTEASPTGYSVTLNTSPDNATFTFVNPNTYPYQFDYKTGILEFTTTTIPANRIYATVYQYNGAFLSSSLNNISASSITASGIYNTGNEIVLGSISASSISGSLYGTSSWSINAISSSYSANGGGSSLTTGSTYPITSSWSNNSISSSYSTTSSYSSFSLSSSYAANVASGLSGGTNNYIPLWASGTTLSSSVIYQSGSNIGIGLNTPINTLQVQGNISGSSFTGSVLGTSSWSNNAVSSSYLSGSVGQIVPINDGVINLGSPSNRFNALYAVQSTIGAFFEVGLRTQGIGENPTGTIVTWRNGKLIPSDKEEDALVMGVVWNGKDEPIIIGAETILVTGKVEEGDYIVTSNKVGHGKAIKRGNFFKNDLFGKVIAQALEDSNEESKLIKAMIRKM